MECSRSGLSLCFAVDVIHKYACIALLIGIQTLAFGNHITDIFMVLSMRPFARRSLDCSKIFW